MSAYTDLEEPAQIEVLRALAIEAAPAFGLDPDSPELVAHAYNTTFALTGPQGRVAAMRIGTGSTSGTDDVVAQHAFIRHLARAGLIVPEPLPTTTGAEALLVPSTALGRDVVVTVARWLDGPDLETLAGADVRELGRTTAAMHAAAESFVMPPGGVLPELVGPLFGDTDRITGHPSVPGPDAAVIAESLRRTQGAFARVALGGQLLPCHADLHGANLKRGPSGELAVFDFDDMGLTHPVLDLAITAFYLADVEDREVLLAGYASERPLPAISAADFQALIASRQLLLANDLLTSTTASLRAISLEYLGVSAARLRHWLETGTFDKAVASTSA